MSHANVAEEHLEDLSSGCNVQMTLGKANVTSAIRQALNQFCSNEQAQRVT